MDKERLTAADVALRSSQPARPLGRNIIRNAARCRKCGDVIESRSRHDMVKCSCRAIAVDGGLDYLYRLGSPDDCEELSEFTD